MSSRDIIEAIAENLGIPTTDVDFNANLLDDLGLNPVEITDLLSNIAHRFNIIFDQADLQNLETVKDMVELVEDKLLE